MAPGKNTLTRALEASVAELVAAKIEFALVGGLAVGIRADPRVTRDIDFVVPAESDRDAEELVFALQALGFRVESVFIRAGDRISTVRTRHRAAPQVLIDFLVSNARIEQEIVDAASWETVSDGVICPVAQPWHLIAMKVLANRLKDQPDLQQLIESANAATLRAASTALKTMQTRGAGDQRDLLAELRTRVASVRDSRKFEKSVSATRLAALLAGTSPRKPSAPSSSRRTRLRRKT